MQTGMSPAIDILRTRILLVPALLLALSVGACSGDDGPTAPYDPGDSDTPALPTIDNPGDQLPDRSDFLVTDIAPLQNLSPDLAGYTAAGLAELNEACVLDFRLAPGRRQIYRDGVPCFPAGLQFDDSYNWYDFSSESVDWPFVALGQYGDSYYYVCTTPTRWMYADVSCRCLGGRLADINTADENAFLVEALDAVHPGEHFIGLTDWASPSYEWFWTSGAPVGWTNWRAGEPNYLNSEKFVHMHGDGTWNNTTFTQAFAYILETDAPLEPPCPDPVPCAYYETNQPVFLGAAAGASVAPHVQRRLYWKRIFQLSMDAGNEYTYSYTKTRGVSETQGQSFGWSIGVSVSASWGFISATIESEFHQDFHREMTISDEVTTTHSYTALPADPGKIKVVALWQLYERFVITDADGVEWEDPRFELAAPLPCLDQGLDMERLQTLIFDAP